MAMTATSQPFLANELATSMPMKEPPTTLEGQLSCFLEMVEMLLTLHGNYFFNGNFRILK